MDDRELAVWYESLVKYDPAEHSPVLLWSRDLSRRLPSKTWAEMCVNMFNDKPVGRPNPHWSCHVLSQKAADIMDICGNLAWPVNDHLLQDGQGGLDWPGAE